MMTAKPKEAEGLALLRQPFPANLISKLPKPTKAQTDAVKADFKKGIRCQICGSWHHPDVVHLDYVGHAALTDRLLDTDINWSWEPVAFNAEGLPAFDKNGGLWIRLTVLGVTRLGYGSADGKSGGDAVKEIIGDALRNSAMRFGAALDLWHKGDLHADDGADEDGVVRHGPAPRTKLDGPHTSKTALKEAVNALVAAVRVAESDKEINRILIDGKETVHQANRDWPALIDGDPSLQDGEEDGSLRAAVAARRALVGEDSMVAGMIRSMKECKTVMTLTNWLIANEEAIEKLDGAEARTFELARNLHESGIEAMDTVTGGA